MKHLTINLKYDEDLTQVEFTCNDPNPARAAAVLASAVGSKIVQTAQSTGEDPDEVLEVAIDLLKETVRKLQEEKGALNVH